MSQKHLKELLKEDQEPFQLKDYIAERQCQLKKQTQIQLKNPKPISKSKSFSCKNACFFSLQDSPDLRKSPLFEFARKSPNRVFLNVPAKTAALLLDAAIRIQKPKTHVKNSGLGLFGSMLKRLTLRTKKLRGSETEEEEREKTGENRGEKEATVSSSSSSSSSTSSCSWNGRQSSLDLESSSSGRSFDGEDQEGERNDDGFEFTNVVRENGSICLSPFRFSLLRSPSPDRRPSPFSSPAKSPARRKTQDNINYEKQSSVKLEEEEEDEEDKEQNSPVSVLDPPFEDDDYNDDHEDDDGLEGSYAFVQRAKQQLLHKLRRFEKLAELDPVELEKILIEEEGEEHDQEYEYESFRFEEQSQVDGLIDDIIRKSGFQDKKKPGFQKLVYDLIIEESAQNALEESDEQVIVKTVCKRLEAWNEVESNTIDMMVGMDLRGETIDWKKNPREQIGEVAIDVEAGIFAILVEELVEDMSNSTFCGV